MKKMLMGLVACLLFACAAVAMDSIEGPKSCTKCGMDRVMFSRSRMLVTYGDGTSAGVCSIHCAAADLQHNKNKQVGSLKVGDYVTKQLLDAKTATWVIGGKQRGVMTATPKWAFAKPEDARRFINENGGTVNSFDQALDLATREVKEQNNEEKKVKKELHRQLH